MGSSRANLRESLPRRASLKKSECGMKGRPGNTSESGIGLSTWKITACWRVNPAVKKHAREGADSPCRESSRHLAQIFFRFLPVAHCGWVNSSPQLLHPPPLSPPQKAPLSLPPATAAPDP